MQIAVSRTSGPEGPRSDPAWCLQVDVVFGTHNVGRAAALLGAAAESGPIVEILEETALEEAGFAPSALAGQAGSWATPGS